MFSVTVYPTRLPFLSRTRKGCAAVRVAAPFEPPAGAAVSAEAVRRSPAAPAMTASQAGRRVGLEDFLDESERIDAVSSVYMQSTLLHPSGDSMVRLYR